MLEASYLRQQAEACIHLSQTTFDLGLAARLRAMADELRHKAAELERGVFEDAASGQQARDNGGNRQ